MSQNVEKYYIPKHLDAVNRFMIFTQDEIAVILATGGVVAFFDLILGLIAGGLSYIVYKRFKGAVGAGSVKAIIYWYLPHHSMNFKNTPCSSYRRYYF